MAFDISALLWVVSIIFILIFLVFILFFLISLLRWFRAPRIRYLPIRAEDYMCPRCGSKDLEIIGARTLRCRKCGTMFTLRTAAPEGYWVIWPFFWWFPIMLLIPLAMRRRTS